MCLDQASGGTLQGSVLVSRKSSSTPSLSEAVEPKLTVASTDQVASAENLTSSSSSEPVSIECILPEVIRKVSRHDCVIPCVVWWLSGRALDL